MISNELLRQAEQKERELLSVLKYPHPILSKRSLPVEEITEEIVQFCHNLVYTMYKQNGIGLAAPQVGKSLRIFVIDVNYEREKILNPDGSTIFEYSDLNPMVFINPEISIISDDIAICQEGCLSVPGIYEEVERPASVRVDYLDLNGQKQTLEAEELLATCLQHEHDHLNGIVFLDRLSLVKRTILKKKAGKKK